MKNLNFGVIKESILAELTESYLKNKDINSTLIDDFYKMVNESKLLSLQNEVYDKLTSKVIESENLATRYIDNTMKLFEDFTINEYNKCIKLLESFILENKINITNTNTINESIDYLIKNSLKSTKKVNVDQLHESFINVLETVKTKKESDVISEEVQVVPKEVIKIAVSNYNKKYSDLSESDNKVLRILSENNHTNKTNLFNEITEDIKKIFEDLNEDQEKSSLVIEKIINMPKDSKSIDESIITIYDLKCELMEN